MSEFSWREEGGLHCNPVRDYIILSKYLIFFYHTSSLLFRIWLNLAGERREGYTVIQLGNI
jgi:hypothetical protein